MKTYNEIFDKVQTCINESFNIPKDKITPKTLISEELALDSLDKVDILVWMEKDYGTT